MEHNYIPIPIIVKKHNNERIINHEIKENEIFIQTTNI